MDQAALIIELIVRVLQHYSENRPSADAVSDICTELINEFRARDPEEGTGSPQTCRFRMLFKAFDLFFLLANFVEWMQACGTLPSFVNSSNAYFYLIIMNAHLTHLMNQISTNFTEFNLPNADKNIGKADENLNNW